MFTASHCEPDLRLQACSYLQLGLCNVYGILMCFDLHKAITSPDITLHTDVRDIKNLTALHYACANGNKELIQYLVEELKCDVGEFVGACLRMTACDNQGLFTSKQK